MSHDCDFDTALSNADSPPRPAVDTSLGVFAPLFGWLLRTESRDLTLIVGLLGFGLFGAISSSFIRQESESTTRNIFVRGIWAAILVYLAVVGGLAVFAQGSAVPNPYAIYFTCFVAAVFSEDVWSWAKSRQQEMFGASDLKKTPPS